MNVLIKTMAGVCPECDTLRNGVVSAMRLYARLVHMLAKHAEAAMLSELEHFELECDIELAKSRAENARSRLIVHQDTTGCC